MSDKHMPSLAWNQREELIKSGKLIPTLRGDILNFGTAPTRECDKISSTESIDDSGASGAQEMAPARTETTDEERRAAYAWCPKCGVGNDVADYAHLPTCPTLTTAICAIVTEAQAWALTRYKGWDAPTIGPTVKAVVDGAVFVRKAASNDPAGELATLAKHGIEAWLE